MGNYTLLLLLICLYICMQKRSGQVSAFASFNSWWWQNLLQSTEESVFLMEGTLASLSPTHYTYLTFRSYNASLITLQVPRLNSTYALSVLLLSLQQVPQSFNMPGSAFPPPFLLLFYMEGNFVAAQPRPFWG